jgi:lysophospholipase L1-like esterase
VTSYGKNRLSTFLSKYLLSRFGKETFFHNKKKSGLKQIYIFGDSNSLCSSKKMASWPKLLYHKAPSTLRIKNDSCYGRTTQFDDEELNGLDTFKRRVKKLPFFDYAFFMVGTNDVKKQYGPPSVIKVSEGMEKIINIAVSHNIAETIVMITPPPMDTVSLKDFDPGYSMIKQISHEYRLLVKKYSLKIIDLHKCLDSQKHLGNDNIHLNASGRVKVADIVWKEFF